MAGRTPVAPAPPGAQDPSLHVIEASTVMDFGKAKETPQQPLSPGLRAQKRLGANEAIDSQFEKEVRLILKLVALWIALLVLPLTERTLLDLRTYYGLFIGLGLVFVMYGLTIHSIFAFLQHRRREVFYIWIGFLLWSLFICCILAVFAIEYDLLPRTSEPSLAKSRPLIDYLYYEIMTFTTVGYGDIVPLSAQGKLLAICTALLGATHGVTFVAIILQALTQHPPAKSQE